MRKRLIPILQIFNDSMVKTRKFQNFKYIGDPINSSRIFNELCADELLIVDISENRKNGYQEINFPLIERLAGECFMPLTYGGKIRSVADAKNLIRIGIEKISINSVAIEHPRIVKEVSEEIGSSSTVVSVDVKMNPFNGQFTVFTKSGTKPTHLLACDWIEECIENGAGEILLTDIDREGTWKGMREEFIELGEKISEIPVILHGGISNYLEVNKIQRSSKVSALGVGNIVCFQRKNCGVLINYPEDNLNENSSIDV